MDHNTVICGDCLEVMQGMDENSVDAIVTDPPYGLSFMGKEWDHGIPGVPFWQEAIRVVKPGAHMLAFGGTRTHHRLMVAIEDAGWEIRDCLMYLYGSGFPKGRDIAWDLHQKACIECGHMVMYDNDAGREEASPTSTTRGEPASEYNMRFVRATYLQTPVYACAKCGQVLQPFMPEQNTQTHRKTWFESETIWPEQPGVERGDNMETTKGKLQGCPLCQMSHGILADGSEGWVHNGTSVSGGTIPWQIVNEDGSRPSYRPQSLEQYYNQPNALRIEREAQKKRGFNVALKPAWEPIILARKPLEGTVAENVLKWGTGGINVDGGRIGTSDDIPPRRADESPFVSKIDHRYGTIAKRTEYQPTVGRWPANLLLDDPAAAMLDEQSGECGAFAPIKGTEGSIPAKGDVVYGFRDRVPAEHHGRVLGASRFFYTSKADSTERNKHLIGLGKKCNDGRDTPIDNPFQRGETIRKNHHPTVKPVDLLRYLCRLITPPGGVVLDPFAGSGSTGIAAHEEGFDYILIEIDPEYHQIAKIRNAQKRIGEFA